MRYIGTAIGTVFLVTSFGSLAQAEELAKGQELHQLNCVSCHGTEVYTRENRMIGSMDSLITQVNRCNVNLNTGWFDDEVGTVARYLNENYYKF